jgi:hypothetical protein
MSKIRKLLLSLIAASALSVAPIAISQAFAHGHHHHHMMAPASSPSCGGVIGETFGCIFY